MTNPNFASREGTKRTHDCNRVANRRVVIVGSSVRAAAGSAVRAGWHPVAIDQFADDDTRATCPAERIENYPRGLVDAVNRHPAIPLLYAGALENHPDLIAQLAAGRTLFGNDADVLRTVRNPWRLSATLGAHGLRFPEIADQARAAVPCADSMERVYSCGEPLNRLRAGQDWLRKPVHSGGGIGVRRLTTHDSHASEKNGIQHAGPHEYWQRFIPGTPIGATFLASARGAELIGVTRQLVGCDWAGARDFLYVGSIGPIPVAEPIDRQLVELGKLLAKSFHLRGLFGVDAIVHKSEVWTIEVNPRYTASVEVLERATDRRLLGEHIATFFPNSDPPIAPTGIRSQVIGKAVVYAKSTFEVNDRFAEWMAQQNADRPWPVVADVPARNTRVVAGQPICTVFSNAESECAVFGGLTQLARAVFEHAACELLRL